MEAKSTKVQNSKPKISRRDFLKLAGAGLGILALNPNKVVRASEILNEIPFSVDVYPWEGNAFYPRLVNFDNSVDFPLEPIYEQEKPEINHASFDKQTNTQISKSSPRQDDQNEPNPVWIMPQFAIKVDEKSEEREFAGLVIDAATVPAYAMIASALFAGYAKKGEKGLAIAGGATLATGLIKAVTSAMTKPLNPKDKDYYERFAGVTGQYYPVFPQFSSIRSQIIMDDIWHNLDARYHQEPIQALSFSNIDGLENFSKKKAEFLKKQLIADSKFNGTIVQSAISAGSLDNVFNYTIEDLSTGEIIEQKLSDWRFLSDLNRKLGDKIPPKPYPGSYSA